MYHLATTGDGTLCLSNIVEALALSVKAGIVIAKG